MRRSRPTMPFFVPLNDYARDDADVEAIREELTDQLGFDFRPGATLTLRDLQQLGGPADPWTPPPEHVSKRKPRLRGNRSQTKEARRSRLRDRQKEAS